MRLALTWFAQKREIALPITYREPDIALAYEFLPGHAPVVVFLPGFASDMGGTKAIFLRDACAARGQAILRLDYAGHGASGGKFTDGCIGDWTADAAHIIETATGETPLLLIGSSMGGWIALLLALKFTARLAAMLLIAPAPDFTERLMRPQLSAAQLEALQRDGVIYQPSDYGEPTPMTLKLLEDGAQHLLLDSAIAVRCPVRVLHGMRDPDVPWQQSLTLAEQLESEDVRLIFVKDGDHRPCSRSSARIPANPSRNVGYFHVSPSAALVLALATFRFSAQKLNPMADIFGAASA
jgi:pimeloyl-ACP methyl ester carboxylesterase